MRGSKGDGHDEGMRVTESLNLGFGYHASQGALLRSYYYIIP